jgi:formylglycine-generating enzyme required for sulfatase activity
MRKAKKRTRLIVIAVSALLIVVLIPAAYSVRILDWGFKVPQPGRGMVFVPGGAIRLGCPQFIGYQCAGDHWPHDVELSPFYIDVHEVTVRQYAACVRAGVCPWNETLFRPTEAPIGKIGWHDAEAFCLWAGKSLPTEAEWEKAARGAQAWIYPWGNEWDPKKANFCDGNDCDGSIDGYAGWSRPEAFPSGVSPYGVMDMAGNMLEWVRDWYSLTYYKTSPAKDPEGPETGTAKVVRGGSYEPIGMGTPEGLNSWFRRWDPPEERPPHMGFRCVVEQSVP